MSGNTANAGWLINHVWLNLDASTSMTHLSKDLIKVVKELVRQLAERSQDMGQETRVSIYRFASRGTPECLIWDRDVLRLPDIETLYRVGGMTALMDSHLLILGDMRTEIGEKYGSHAHLVFNLTDGIENDSRADLYQHKAAIKASPRNVTDAVFVPDLDAHKRAIKLGWAEGNIQIWDATSVEGLQDMAMVIRDTTFSFMESRASGTGFVGTSNLFTLNQPSPESVKAATAVLTPGSYSIYECTYKTRADEFIHAQTGKRLVLGNAYYQLTKRETIQPQKQLAIMTADGTIHVGREVRAMLGLPNYHVDVSPNAHPEYTIFVQSTAPNRNFMPGTKVLYLR